MHLLVETKREPVAQDVEPDLVGGSVGNVAGVSGAALGGRHALLHVAHGEAQKTVDVPHPAGVAAGQVIVDGHDVYALPFPGEPRDRRNSGQRLAFACLHLRDAAAGEG